jgi:hypothetical protein
MPEFPEPLTPNSIAPPPPAKPPDTFVQPEQSVGATPLKPSEPKTPNLDQYLAIYETFRNYVRHEDTLINNRLTWILTIHGFLYATYGFTLQKELEVMRALQHHTPYHSPLCYTLSQAEIFLLGIAFVGASISFFGWLSIHAAKQSASSIDRIFRQNNFHDSATLVLNGSGLNIQTFPGPYKFPAILGGGRKYSVKFGVSASITIPWILFASWFISIGILLLVWQKSPSLYCWRPSIDEIKSLLRFYF